jgi:hypothetical protein
MKDDRVLIIKLFLMFGTPLLALIAASAAHAGPTWTFGVTQTIETFIAPVTGPYDITAVGAQGTPTPSTTGGLDVLGGVGEQGLVDVVVDSGLVVRVS